MIRVLYRWSVAEGNTQIFFNTWREATRTIHRTVPGALGSFCLQDIEDSDTLITVALWRTEAEWRAFIPNAPEGPMKALHQLATLISATPCHQLADETIAP